MTAAPGTLPRIMQAASILIATPDVASAPRAAAYLYSYYVIARAVPI